MPSPWQIRDLIDFEYFLREDEEVSGDELHRRDRKWYLLSEDRPQERGKLFHQWLAFRREERKARGELDGPGEAFNECLTILHRIVPMAGLVSGAGLAIALLQYHGVQAVNVSTYFGLLIVLQVVMLLVLLVAMLYRKKKAGQGLHAAYPLLSHIVYTWAFRLSIGMLGKLDGEQRNAIRAGFGDLKIKKAIYGRVIFHPVFQLVQLFGVLFNVGALAATLLRVMMRDIAFGWQSTLQVSPNIVYEFAKTLAAPWRWALAEGTGYPSLEQVEGSRMVLKEGLLHLETADLVSWWPFLCLCLVTYGMVPRMALWCYALYRQRQSLMDLNFSHAACDRLERRMKTPTLDTSDRSSARVCVSDEAIESRTKSGVLPSNGEDESTLLLVPAEMASEFDGNQLARIVECSVGRAVSHTRPFTVGRQGIGDLGIEARESVTIFQEAWQPPIQEYLAFIRRLRDHVAPDTSIVILLNGRTKPGEDFGAVSDRDRTTWKQVIKTLADPYLTVAEVVLS